MPFRSNAQRRFFHSKASPVGPSVVAEYDAATKGMSLPERVAPVKLSSGGEIQPDRFEQTFDRRRQAGVQNPRKETDLSFAARLAEEASRRPSRSLFSTRLKKE